MHSNVSPAKGIVVNGMRMVVRMVVVSEDARSGTSKDSYIWVGVGGGRGKKGRGEG